MVVSKQMRVTGNLNNREEINGGTSPLKVAFVMLVFLIGYNQLSNRALLSGLSNDKDTQESRSSNFRVDDINGLKSSLDIIQSHLNDAVARAQRLEDGARQNTAPRYPVASERLLVQRAADQDTPLNPNRQLATFLKPEVVANTKIWVHDPKECIWISQRLLTLGYWESGAQEALMDVLPPSRDVLFVDIGGNIGSFSIVMAAAGYSVEAFEPMEYNIELFSKSIHENSLQDHIRLYKVAVGKEFVPKVCLEVHASSTRQPNMGNNRLSDTAQDRGNNCVPLFRLDAIVSRCPDLVKVDVEGLEKNALIGLGVDLQGTCRPKAICLEDTGHGESAIPHLTALGYQCTKISGADSMCQLVNN